MSQILSEWLNKEIILSQEIHPSGVDQAFRSGYLFGELLNKFDLQKDFDQFRSTKSTDSWVSNYVKIEPTLRKLGIPFNAKVVKDLMDGMFPLLITTFS